MNFQGPGLLPFRKLKHEIWWTLIIFLLVYLPCNDGFFFFFFFFFNLPYNAGFITVGGLPSVLNCICIFQVSWSSVYSFTLQINGIIGHEHTFGEKPISFPSCLSPFLLSFTFKRIFFSLQFLWICRLGGWTMVSIQRIQRWWVMTRLSYIHT
jgi:hypothetical protein